ncbi:hypothetical protein WD019_09580 [Fictibacillus sp. Mic-4]|uniref:hypothetical protein n=1 Tax=Fictibacillus TaxID=1329200 RepID=UPI0004793A56|nr:hypothetical protein [Fictibacillus gelatini]
MFYHPIAYVPLFSPLPPIHPIYWPLAGIHHSTVVHVKGSQAPHAFATIGMPAGSGVTVPSGAINVPSISGVSVPF